jgi:hypothetical protein
MKAVQSPLRLNELLGAAYKSNNLGQKLFDLHSIFTSRI